MRWDWLDRVLLLPRLRVAMQVRAMPRAYATLYAIDCSPQESAQLATIGSSQLVRLGTGMQCYLEVTRPIPRVRVLCFGASSRLQKVPPVIRHWTGEPFGGGVWLRELRAALALFEGGNPIRRIVIHELAHALLDVLTDGFPYPLCIVEGFARRAEFLLPDDAGVIEWERQCTDSTVTDTGCLNDSQCMSVKELLFFDPAKYWRHDVEAFLRMTNLSFWMNVYLFKLSDQRPGLARILRELRVENVRTPEGVYGWLQQASRMQEDQLEESFHSFCTTGLLPVLTDDETEE